MTHTRGGFRCLLSVLLASLVVLGASNALAQTAGTGALSGTIKDPSGAAVPGATITAVSSATGQVRTSTTSQTGAYSFTLLQPGEYLVVIEATGFATAQIPVATVRVTETTVLDYALQVGALNESLTVTAAAPIVQTTNSALGTTVAARTVVDLPLATRNYTNLLAMSAGANAPVQNASQIGKASAQIAVNGAGPGQNTWSQDGVSIGNWLSFNTGIEGTQGKSFAIPPPDAISEFKIQTSSYDAGYGLHPGASVNVVTKSGTNKLSGAAYEFFRNTKMNANDWFRNYQGLPRGQFDANQYGGVFGGPIQHDKLFFFASMQETNQTNGLTGFGASAATLPPIPGGDRGSCPPGWTSLSQCNAAGQAFLSNMASTFCPPNHPGDARYTTNQATSVQVLCAPNAASPLANINPVAINLLQLKNPNGEYLVQGSGSDTFATRNFSDPATFKDHNLMLNFDYVVNSKHSLIGRYQYERAPTNGSFLVLNSTRFSSKLPGNGGVTTALNHYGLVKLNSVLTNRLMNEGYFGYTRAAGDSALSDDFRNSQVGMALLDPKIDKLSDITVTGLFEIGSTQFYPSYTPVGQYKFGDQISWVPGRQTIRAGFDGEKIRVSETLAGQAIGQITFPKLADFLIGRAGGSTDLGGNGAAASNIQTVAGNINASTTHNYRVTELSAFVQDDFKVNERLTVNAGLRWEYHGWPTEANGLFTNVWPSLVQQAGLPGNSPTTGTLAGIVVPANYPGDLPPGATRNTNDSLIPATAPQVFGPRVGFAWLPTGSPRWAVRAGGGLFFDSMAGITQTNLLITTMPARLSLATGGSNMSLQNPWPYPTGVIVGPDGTAGFAPRWVNPATNGSSNLSQGVFAEDMKIAKTYAWNVNSQYEFLPNWVMELAYVGSKGVDQAPQTRGGQGSSTTELYNVAWLASPNCASCTLTGTTTNTVQNVPLRVQNLGVSPTAVVLATDASYKFKSLQATVRHNFSKGFLLQAAYTWSDATITQLFGVNYEPYLVHREENNNGYRPNRLAVSYTWELPLGHPKSGLRYLIEGWALTGVTTIQSGAWMTVTDNAGSIFFGGQGQAFPAQLCPGKTNADLQTGGSMTDRVTSGLNGGPGYLNGKPQGVLCALPAFGNGTGFGNMDGGVVRGPAQNNWDMSIGKTFRLPSNQALMVRAEAFNIWNTPQFDVPNLTANSSTFGQITSMSVNPRLIQLAVKYMF